MTDNLDFLLRGQMDLNEAQELVKKAGTLPGPTGTQRLSLGMATVQHLANRRNLLQRAGVPIPQGLERLEGLMLEHVLTRAAQEIAQEKAEEEANKEAQGEEDQEGEDAGDDEGETGTFHTSTKPEGTGASIAQVKRLQRGVSTPPTIKKALNVLGKSGGVVSKAWQTADGLTHIEGWISTDHEDLEHDVVPPECFKSSLADYMARSAPLSSEHNPKALPIGHLQRSALVRDGKVFLTALHPTDSDVSFAAFPGTGTGWYARGVITDSLHGTAVTKGNIGGFSWIGNVREYEPLSPKGRRFLKVDPLIESTVAAYPVNPKAVLVAAKAYQSTLAELLDLLRQSS